MVWLKHSLTAVVTQFEFYEVDIARVLIWIINMSLQSSYRINIMLLFQFVCSDNSGRDTVRKPLRRNVPKLPIQCANQRI